VHENAFNFCILIVLTCLFILYNREYSPLAGTAVAQWLSYSATNPKVAGSILDGVIGIFHLYNPSARTMALGSTQPLTEISTRIISWGVNAAGA
jgi:hypothetical protein